MHYAVCGKYLVTCPNKCKDDLYERSKIEDHVNNYCPLTEISCPFAYAGCEVKLPRKDMPGHTADISIHFHIFALFTQKIEQKQKAMEKQFGEKQRAMKQYFEEKLKATRGQNQVLEEKIKATESKVVMLEDTQQMKNALGKFPIDFHVDYVQKEFFLHPFFTHPHGYKLCIRVGPNGTGEGEGTHVSVYIYLMQGPFDDQLKWPFRGEITIQIVNQAGDHSHVKRAIRFSDETQGKHGARVIGKKRSETGWGHHTFLAHTDVGYNAAKKTQYLKDKIIIVGVVHIKLTQ